ncbi:MAG TPA: antibiotic biosynthesis monooxygenase [Deltaproteobacteria bacterium]|nr:antibiotic biosynthesis monooxygenase [Deltaproteobacteria bacterium]
MALTKIIIERKIKPGMENEFKRLMQEVLSRAVHSDGFISGETLQSVDDPTLYVTISQWKDISFWNDWVNSTERKKRQEEYERILSEPTRILALRYE